MKKNILQVAALIIFSSFGACKTTSNANSTQTTEKRANHKQHNKKQRPSATATIAKMDTNNDGKLSENEVEGPLKKDFSKIDSNNDGFITKEELENAPKPERREQRPQ